MEGRFLQKFTSLSFDGIDGEQILTVLKESKAHAGNNYHGETLYEHLLSAATHTHAYALERGWCEGEESQWIYYLTGFFHDIGKHGSYRKQFRNTYSTKGHGLLGAAILESWLINESFAAEFSLDESDIEAIILTTNYHMCMYVGENCNSMDFERIKLLQRCMTYKALKLLVALRYGDSKGKIGSDGKHGYVNPTIQERFESLILNYDASTHDQEFMGKGLLINITGFSGSGKTHLANELIEYLVTEHRLILGKDVVYISRDKIVNDIVSKGLFRCAFCCDLVSVPVFYNPYIYVFFSTETGQEEDVFSLYKSNKAYFSPKVNRIIEKTITDYINAERICIVDSMACMNPFVRKEFYKNISASAATRIDLMAFRFPDTFTDEETLERKGVTAEEQRAINDTGGVDQFDVIGKNVKWHKLHSVMESRDTYLVDDSNPYQSHFCIPVCHNSNIMRKYVKETLLKRIIESRSNGVDFTVPPTIVESSDMSLKELIERLMKTRGGLTTMSRFFKAHNYHFTVQDIDGDCVAICVKYIDKANRLWIPRWTREARGAGFLIFRNNKVIEIKKTLPRCVEVLTQNHDREGVHSTQDIPYSRDVSFIDEKQKEIIDVFSTEDSLWQDLPRDEEWFLSNKVDGSLLVVSVFPANSEQYMYMAPALQSEECVYKPWCLLTETHLVTPATSGSLCVSERMKSTVVTAIGSGAFGHVYEDSEDADKIWDTRLKKPFYELIMAVAMSNKPTTVMTEIVCAKRRTYDRHEHRELAVSYKDSGIYLLGIYYGDIFHPTRLLPPDMINAVSNKFKIPASCRISKPMDAIWKLQNLHKLLTDKDEAEERKYLWMENNLHPEGFILTRSKVGDLTQQTSCKLKLPLYYKVHALQTTEGDVNEKELTIAPVDIFPEVDRFLYFRNRLPVDVEKFCVKMLEELKAAMTNERVPESITKKIDSGVQEDFEGACQFITAVVNSEKFMTAMLKTFSESFTRQEYVQYNPNARHELIKQLRTILLRNKPWAKKKSRCAPFVHEEFLKLFK